MPWKSAAAQTIELYVRKSVSDSDGNRTELKKPLDSAMCPLASSSRNGWMPQPRGAHLAGAFGRCSSKGTSATDGCLARGSPTQDLA